MKIFSILSIAGATFYSFAFAQTGLPPGLAAKLPPSAPMPQSSADRFPISTIPTNLTTPGSYYLITNLTGVAGTNGITVKSDDVTIDLNGFALIGVTNSGIGIAGGSYGDLTVRNGTIRGWRAGASSNEGGATSWDRIQFANNFVGLTQGDGWAVVSRCTATFNASDGIIVEGATVSECVSSFNGGSGFVMRGTVARDCAGYRNKASGFVLLLGSKLSNSLVHENEQNGILALYTPNVIIGNTCYDNNWPGNLGFAGIHLASSGNKVEGNHVTYSGGFGILVDAGATKNVIVKNSTVGDKTMSNSIPAGNDSGPWGDAATAISPWANLAE